MLNCTILKPPSFTAIWSPCNFSLKFIIQNPSLDCCWACCKVSKMIFNSPIVQKVTKKIGSLEKGFCQTRALVVSLMGTVTKPNQLLPSTNCEYFAKIYTFSQKLFNFCPKTATNTFCIPICNEICIEITTLIWFLCSLTHSFVKD